MSFQRPSWDEYFLTLAEQVSTRSPDPNTRHGCVLVSADNRVVSTGSSGSSAKNGSGSQAWSATASAMVFSAT